MLVIPLCYHIQQYFQGGKLSWLERKIVIHRKTFTSILILLINTAIDSQENIHSGVNNQPQKFPTQKSCHIRYFIQCLCSSTQHTTAASKVLLSSESSNSNFSSVIKTVPLKLPFEGANILYHS